MGKMTLDRLVEQLTAVYGQELVGIALYGSAARGDEVARHSDLNVLVVVQHVTMDHLHREAPVARAWREAGNPPPLTLTRAEWMGSADIFPIEYADILAHHKVLAGALPLDGIDVELSDLRLQLEHEAMSVLLRLRHAIMAADGDDKAILSLLEESVSAMLVLLRAALRLSGESPAADSVDVCARFSVRSGRDASAVLRVVRHKRGVDRMSPRDAAGHIESYLHFAESLVVYLDAFSQTSQTDGGFPA
ncbi:MAG: nucleotidyltransferase domain-containing protein [Gemmatimonadetes bacterium]|nr:nucleotidyltransferase domain-containing protein [Gemmatimonadota bacterium]MCC6770159.1 nucleotidyltransferase domain-containing protein [Gemmatimonadaceae bacterium]